MTRVQPVREIDGAEVERGRVAAGWLPAVGGYVPPLLVAGAVFLVAFDSGSYALTSRNTLAIAVWWAVALGVGLTLWPLDAVPRRAAAAGAFLLGFSILTGFSMLWAEDAERAFNELTRAALYLGIFAATVLAASRGSALSWIAGIALGLTTIGLLALASRLFPQALPASDIPRFLPAEKDRLSYPVEYWNGLATLIGLAVPLLLACAVAARTALGRAAAVAPLPALAVAIYLTSSRGATLATILGVLAFLALSTGRIHGVLAIAIAGAGAVAATAVVLTRPSILEAAESPALRSEGRSAAMLILLLCIVVGVVYAAAARVTPADVSLHRHVRLVLAGVAVAALVAGVIAADLPRQFEAFKEPTEASSSVAEHFSSASGNGRWQWWGAAVDQWQSSPVIGHGAGSYEAWWLEHGTLPVFVRDAHSLYLETLGELGVLGLALLLGFFVTALSGLRQLLRGARGGHRAAVAGLAGAVAVYLAEAGIDWMWELTAVSIIAFACLGLLAGPAAERTPAVDSRAISRRRALSVRAAVVVVALAAIAASTIPLLAQTRIQDSQTAVRRGDLDAALTSAREARSLQPWASSPWLQLALVEEEAGNLDDAHASIREALERGPSDWRLWLIAARLETKLGLIADARRSLDRAVELNPRSPLFARR